MRRAIPRVIAKFEEIGWIFLQAQRKPNANGTARTGGVWPWETIDVEACALVLNGRELNRIAELVGPSAAIVTLGISRDQEGNMTMEWEAEDREHGLVVYDREGVEIESSVAV